MMLTRVSATITHTYTNTTTLELLLLQTVLEAEQHGHGLAIDITVLQHGDQTLAVHRFTGEELQVLEATEQILHHFVDVRFEDFHLAGRLLLQPGDKSVWGGRKIQN